MGASAATQTRYFSQISPPPEIDGSDIGALNTLAAATGSPYQQHQWLWQFFPNTPRGSEQPFVFRRMEPERLRQPSATRFREQTLYLPHFYLVSEQAPTPVDDVWQVSTPKRYDPQVDEGDVVQFELRANPTKRARDTKKNVDVVMDAKTRLKQQEGVGRWGGAPDEARLPLYELVKNECFDWLAKRGEHHGFVLDSDRDEFVADSYASIREPRRNLSISTVDLKGRLHVTDPERFRHALMNGMGRAQAFGCGLLLVRRVL